MSDAESASRKPRVGFVKSRTGCSVCKIRRIKCDETKPSCVRCTSSGRICEGYSINRKPKTSSKISHVLVPKPPIPAASNSPSPGKSSFGDDWWSKQFWDKTATQVQCCLGSRFLEQVVDKAVTEPPIKCLVLAVGALNHTCPISQADLASRNVSWNVHECHLYALQQYELAIKILRDPAFTSSHAVTTTLIASILIVFFEAIHGNVSSARRQFYAGLEVIKNCPERASVTPFSPPTSIADELYNAYRHLHLQMSLINIFLKSERDYQTIFPPESLYSTCYTLPIPVSFGDPEEARLRLEGIVSSGLDLVLSLDMYCPSTSDEWCHSSTISLEEFPPAVFNRQKELLNELGVWRAAFQQFFEYSQSPAGEHYWGLGIALEAIYMTAWIVISSAFFEEQVEFDAFDPLFNSIVSLCKAIHERTRNHWANSCHFSVDTHIVCPLVIVGLKCRNPKIRTECISLLASIQGRSSQGLWPVSLYKKIISGIMSIENGDGGAVIEERSRAWVYQVQILTHGNGTRTTKVQCQLFPRGHPRKGAESVIRETMVEW